MDAELREFERRLVRSGQNVRIVPEPVAKRTLDYLKQQLRNHKVVLNTFVATCDFSEIEIRERLVKELQEIIDGWITDE